MPGRPWSAGDRTGGPIDDLLDALRTQIPGLIVGRLEVTHPGDDDNVYFIGDDFGEDFVQIDTHENGDPPFFIEANGRFDERFDTSDVSEASATVLAWLQYRRSRQPGASSPISTLNATFLIRDDGQVDAHIDGGWPLFNHALNDSISSLPPRGELGVGPSTYWIDVAEQGARRAAEEGDQAPFTCGNITTLRVVEGQVVASYDFAHEDEPTEAMSLDEFLALLAAWREKVVISASKATAPLPEMYRRNPHRVSPANG